MKHTYTHIAIMPTTSIQSPSLPQKPLFQAVPSLQDTHQTVGLISWYLAHFLIDEGQLLLQDFVTTSISSKKEHNLKHVKMSAKYTI